MSAWDLYPEHYRSQEVQAIQSAARAGECTWVAGLSGAGKSNLLGFLANRCAAPGLSFVLVDGNRARPKTADGFLLEITRALKQPVAGIDPLEAAEGAVAQWIETSGSLCLLFDRFDALPTVEQGSLAGPLRALRDMFKYQLAYVTASRRPPDATSELAELFYAHTLWLGPLSPADSAWSARQYAARQGREWDEETLQALYRLSWGYPSLLRGCCEAFAAGCPLDEASLRAHPAIQRRVQEFWADAPGEEDVRLSGLQGHPFLIQGQPASKPVSADAPEFTALEQRLLAYLQAHPGEVCAKDDLIRAVWPEDRVLDGLRDDSLAQLVRRVRQKIEADASHPQRLLTVPGRGYRLVS